MRKYICDVELKKYCKLCDQAIRCLENKLYMESIELYKKAIEIYPYDFAVYYNIGYAFAGLKEYKTAIQYYDKAIKLNPDDYHAYHNKALSFSSFGEDKLALKYYDKAIELKPKAYQREFRIRNSKKADTYGHTSYSFMISDSKKVIYLKIVSFNHLYITHKPCY